MHKAVTLVFPHQLFENNPALKQGQPVYLVEEWLFFRQYNFHRKKLVLHRASMKFYEDWLQQQQYTVNYIETNTTENDCRELIATLDKQNITKVHIVSPSDDWLLKRLTKACAQHNIALQVFDSPNFLNTPQSVEHFFEKRKTYFQTDFYKWQRKERKILLDGTGQPVGGQWSFDADNRKKFPKKETVPAIALPPQNHYIKEAVAYVQQHFANNYGSIDGPLLFAVTFGDAKQDRKSVV